MKIYRAVMQQALKAIHTGNNQDMVNAQDPLRAALAYPVVEPVTDEENERFSQDISNFKGADPEATMYALEQFLKRRTSPPAWVPLTDERLNEIESEILIKGGSYQDVLRAVADEALHAPQPPQQGWCSGCNPDNCQGCGGAPGGFHGITKGT